MDKTSTRSKTLKYFFLSNKRQVLVLVVASLIVGVLESATIAVVYPILNVAFSGGVERDNFILTFFAWVAGLLPIADKFIAYGVLFVILAVLSFIVRLGFIRFRVRFAGRLVQKNQQAVYNKLVNADYQYFVDHKQGELIYATWSAPVNLQTMINSGAEFLSQIVLSISVLALLFSLSWQGTLVFLFMGLLYYIFTGYLSNKVSYTSGRIQRDAARESSVILAETIEGIKQLKVFDVTAGWISKFSKAIATHWYHYIKIITWQQALVPILMLILYLFIGGIALIIRLMFPDSFSTLIPIFGTFAFAVFRMVPIMTGITSAVMQIMAALPNCEMVYQILHENFTTIVDGSRVLDSFKSDIKFDNVTFTYKERDKLMDGASFTFEKGRTTAIVGGSGSGKTTIINLILRLYEVNDGSIEIDGIDIRQLKMASWLEKIGFVSQETNIFNDTIRNNITFGSTYSDEEIVKVCHYANAHEFISELPEGYDTVVGDRGMRLSGGQKQRIAVARAMIRNPEILIFDEATNALDAISETAVQRAIDEIARDHTVIVIAHRLSTIVNADKIIVIGKGKILEEGTHKELMVKGGAYCDLYRSQVGN